GGWAWRVQGAWTSRPPGPRRRSRARCGGGLLLGRVRPVVDVAFPVLQETASAPVSHREDLSHDGPRDLLRPFAAEVEARRGVHGAQVAGIGLVSLAPKFVQQLEQPRMGAEHADVR